MALLLLSSTLNAAAIDLPEFPSTLLSLDPFFDNQAASVNGSTADFDGSGNSFDGQFLPVGPYLYDGITYELPASWGTGNDNVIANNQTIALPESIFVHELHALYSGDSNATFTADNFILNFVDNSTQTLTLEASNWWGWPLLNLGIIQTPYSLEGNGTVKNLNTTSIFQWSTAVSSEKQLASITLPQVNPGHRLHLFSMAITPSNTTINNAPALVIRRARFTSRWEMVNGTRAQAVQVTIANLLPNSMSSLNTSLNSKHTVEISGPGITTVTPGILNRLVPGDQARVDVLITGSTTGSNATVVIKDSAGNVIGQSSGWTTTALIEEYTADAASLSAHETPTWWNKAKYGIFIHWGVYSYPAWAPPAEYAEWYDYYLHNPPNSSSPTWVHHLETYGPNVLYDDFISNFTASKFNASAWVDLFDRAGARYFVQVTKHHDGFALFDAGNTTNRSAVVFGPKRDLLKELFDTAASEKPHLHRGTYYSLPEWFNPDYAKYGFGQWPGGLARNPFNTTPTFEPYTGHLNITDYVENLQLPQMLTLATQYDTEIMWCDIGGANKTLDFAAAFYNHALASGYQVTLNNRCGAVPDFTTPEYATFNAIQTNSWESSEGMDPFSYGLNTATNASEYKNGTTIIQTLVDIVSKNGNFLLDIGPTAEGEIIEAMSTNLLAAGSWLDYAGECVYDTEYWFQGSQDPNPLDGTNPARFTTTPTTFCIVAFDEPTDGQLIIHQRLPLLPGDEITLLTPNGSHSSLPWSTESSTGNLIVNVSESGVSEVQYAWAFRATYTLNED
ncbi:glycoside hydrolase family 29 protein [Gymnopus androsaceus JB14]|uniref:alpha-L-fucosidase n=1 Tax=Gymnopus androsaceus JB14 TaxID=1447944 RepID=A0A6A4GLV9_9AGAR|nr:glycoside hydrolase family 29 protein [Gymnopus androsaceus JB14]